jgi:hypothetical protein
MSLNVVKLDEEAQADNFRGQELPPPEPMVRTKRTAQEIFALALVLGVGALLILAVLTIWRVIVCWGASEYDLPTECKVAIGAQYGFGGVGLVGMGAYVAISLWGHWRKLDTEALRASVVRDEMGVPTTAHLLARKQYEGYSQERLLAAQTQVAKAQAQPYGAGVDALNVSLHQNSKAEQAAAGVLLQPPDALAPLLVTDWLPKAVDAYHLMLAAETGGGKSTTAKAILAERLRDGDEVFVIDPHFQVGNWFDLPAVGGGRNYDDVACGLRAVQAEMNSRYEEYNAGKKEFRRLTVLIDEVPAIYEQLADKWKDFAKQLGSEARKVNISIVLLTQSPLVQDIGVNTSMQRNFRRIALDAACIRKMLSNDELDKKRREELAVLMSGREWPATMELNGQVWFLDRTGLDRIEAPSNSHLAAWGGWDYETGASVCLEESQNDQNRASTNEPDERTGLYSERKQAYLRALRQKGKTRDQAREILRGYGIKFENADWTAAGR